MAITQAWESLRCNGAQVADILNIRVLLVCYMVAFPSSISTNARRRFVAYFFVSYTKASQA